MWRTMTPRGHQKAFSWGAKHPTFCFAMKDRIMDTRILKRFEEDFTDEIKSAGNDPAASTPEQPAKLA